MKSLAELQCRCIAAANWDANLVVARADTKAGHPYSQPPVQPISDPLLRQPALVTSSSASQRNWENDTKDMQMGEVLRADAHHLQRRCI
jgi:hypothetical protein